MLYTQPHSTLYNRSLTISAQKKLTRIDFIISYVDDL